MSKQISVSIDKSIEAEFNALFLAKLQEIPGLNKSQFINMLLKAQLVKAEVPA